MRKDLTKFDHTIGKIVLDNYDMIMSCTTKTAVLDTIKSLFANENLNTEGSRRMILRLTQVHSLTQSLTLVANYYLAAKGLSTRAKARI